MIINYANFLFQSELRGTLVDSEEVEARSVIVPKTLLLPKRSDGFTDRKQSMVDKKEIKLNPYFFRKETAHKQIQNDSKEDNVGKSDGEMSDVNKQYSKKRLPNGITNIIPEGVMSRKTKQENEAKGSERNYGITEESNVLYAKGIDTKGVVKKGEFRKKAAKDVVNKPIKQLYRKLNQLNEIESSPPWCHNCQWHFAIQLAPATIGVSTRSKHIYQTSPNALTDPAHVMAPISSPPTTTQMATDSFMNVYLLSNRSKSGFGSTSRTKSNSTLTQTKLDAHKVPTVSGGVPNEGIRNQFMNNSHNSSGSPSMHDFHTSSNMSRRRMPSPHHNEQYTVNKTIKRVREAVHILSTQQPWRLVWSTLDSEDDGN